MSDPAVTAVRREAPTQVPLLTAEIVEIVELRRPSQFVFYRVVSCGNDKEKIKGWGTGSVCSVISVAFYSAISRKTASGGFLSTSRPLARPMTVVSAATPSQGHPWQVELQFEHKPHQTPAGDAGEQVVELVGSGPAAYMSCGRQGRRSRSTGSTEQGERVRKASRECGRSIALIW